MHVGMTRFCRQWFSSPDKLAGGLSKIVMAESAPRFASVSEADLGRLVDDKDAKNTKRATKTALRVLQQYLKEKKVPEPQTKDGISNVLKLFYAEARKVDGTSYSKSTLNSLRFGLGRHFKATLGFDIINDPAFAEANKVFGAKCVELKRQGLAKVQHTPPICEEDLKKLYESDVFNQNSPETLQNKVFFEVMLYFCRRGRQNLRELKKTDFSFSTDGKGAKYVCKTTDELTKNRRENDEGFEGGVMFEKPGPHCPVASFERYIQHLNPSNEFLFQRPKKNAGISDQVWYDNMVVGERLLGEKMKRISREAKLSKGYTNHSIRATAVTILDKSGFEARHIMAVSGHRNESSIRSYSRTDISTKRKMSETLTTECEVRGEEVAINPHQLSPVISLSQEEFIVQNSHSEITKNFNFFNCNVNIH